jgi:Rrf2 family nitric oxide-sensitive transcriptional repressor
VEEFSLRLSLYTDFSLRLLMYLAATPRGTWATTPNVARAFGISLHHLQKAVQGLVRGGYVEALQGRGGGVRLAQDPASMRLGAIVAELEGSGCLVDCRRGPCPLAGRCLLKSALDDAERSFIRELDRFTLSDVVASQTKTALNKLVAESAAAP